MSNGIVEDFFDALSSRRWSALADLLASDVVRIGPFGDRVQGRQRYLDLLEGTVPSRYDNDVHQIVYAQGRRSAFARVTEHLLYTEQELHLEEAYAFRIGDDGQLAHIEIFWQTPQFDPGGFGSARASDSFASTGPTDPDDAHIGIPEDPNPV